MHLKAVIVASLASAVVCSDVVDLTKDTFEDFAKSSLSLIEFFAPWCGHCQKLAPEYEKAATTLKEINIPIAKVDCTKEEEICSRAGISGYPTLKVYREGKATDYGGERQADQIVSFMKKQSLPALSIVLKDNFESFTKDNDVVVVAFLKKDSKEVESFRKLAEANRNEFVFGYITDEEIIKKEGVKVPGVAVYKSFDDHKVIYNGDFVKVGDIEKFIKEESVPLIDEIGPMNYQKYMDRKLPLAFTFFSSPEQLKDLEKDIKPLAKSYKGKISFVWIDFTKFGGYAKNLNLGEGKTAPMFAIHDVEKDIKYPLAGEFGLDAITTLVKSVAEGTAKAVLKSEKVPENNDGDVTIVVGDNYEEIVLDDSKDVLIEFYAPWCGHCKNLAPTWEELGKKVKASFKNVVIAKMDATENDFPIGTPFKVQGFPTIKYYPAGDKLNPVDYEGGRDLKDFIGFLKENSSGFSAAADDAKVDEDAGESGDDHDEL